jgi:hypothetical protein
MHFPYQRGWHAQTREFGSQASTIFYPNTILELLADANKTSTTNSEGFYALFQDGSNSSLAATATATIVSEFRKMDNKYIQNFFVGGRLISSRVSTITHLVASILCHFGILMQQDPRL